MLAGAAAGADAPAQWSPTKPVRLIVPFPPGGAVDVIGRIVASRLPERLGQPVVVDNRGGANAIIGTDLAAKAPPDGHTIVIEPAGHPITPSVMRKLPYDVIKDFTAIGLIGNGAYVLIVHPAVPAKTVTEFVAYAKSRPGQLNYAYTGYGNATHLSGELFKVLTGVDMVGIVYKGGGPALTDVMGGQIPAFFAGMASAAAQIKAGKVRALGVTTTRRSAALPEVPTIAEAGVPGYEVVLWYGVLGPKGLPKYIVERWNAEIRKATKLPDLRERLISEGFDIDDSAPEVFQAILKRDVGKWTKVVKDAKVDVNSP
jgi:tripartite-type tricarboxylate transporter receptor subunit TctC